MSKGKMLAISMLITACFVSLAAVLIFFLSDEGFKKIKQAKAENELQSAMAQKQEQEVPVEEEIHTLLDGESPASVVSADNFPLVVHLPGGLRGKSLVRCTVVAPWQDLNIGVLGGGDPRCGRVGVLR